MTDVYSAHDDNPHEIYVRGVNLNFAPDTHDRIFGWTISIGSCLNPRYDFRNATIHREEPGQC